MLPYKSYTIAMPAPMSTVMTTKKYRHTLWREKRQTERDRKTQKLMVIMKLMISKYIKYYHFHNTLNIKLGDDDREY